MPSVVERLRAACQRLRGLGGIGSAAKRRRLVVRLRSFEQFESRRMLTTTVLQPFSATETTIVRTGSIQSGNLLDTYRLTLATPAVVRTDLIGMSANLDIALTDVPENELASSRQLGTSIDTFTSGLIPAGQYNVRVRSVAGALSSYTIMFSTSSGDDLLSGSTPLGTINSQVPTIVSRNSLSGRLDLQDFTSYTVTAGVTIRANLSGLTADLNLQLLDRDGVPLAQGNAAGATLEDVSAIAPYSGQYYVRVWNSGSSASDYMLTVTQDSSGDDLIVNASSLGTLAETRPTARASGSVSRLATSPLDIQDYYRVALSVTADLQVNLSSLGASGQVELQDINGRTVASQQLTTVDGIVNLFVPGLAAGRYVLRVYCDSPGAFSYELIVTTATSSDDLPTRALSASSITTIAHTGREQFFKR